MATRHHAFHTFTTGAAFALAAAVILIAGSCSGFSANGLPSAVAQVGHRWRRPTAMVRDGRRVPPALAQGRRPLRMTGGASPTRAVPGEGDSGGGTVPSILSRCNAGTKWALTLLNTIALWTRPGRYEGPFIVFGSIAAVYLTNAIKRIVDQSRPAGAPFADPGMPSSHALLAFFIAAAWDATGLLFVGSRARASAWLGAAAVAWLRVACGYHSWAQIAVGTGMGGLMGRLWVMLGRASNGGFPKATYYISWALYLTGAAYFISTKMRDWVGKEKHL